MIIEEVDYLKQWLISQLEVISEADSSVLAKYVIALLKKDESFNQETFIEQLEVFLGDATVPFVRNLYEVIESKEYLPVPPKKKRVFTEVAPPKEEKEEIKTERKVSLDNHHKLGTTEQRLVELSLTAPSAGDDESKMTARKRRFEEDRSHRKRPGRNQPREETEITRRFNSENYEERRAERRPYNDRPERTRSDDTRNYPRGVHERVGYPKRRTYSPETRRYSRSPSPQRRSRSPRKTSLSPSRNNNTSSRKERCRDFDEKGYCLRGGLCQYDHGADPVVVEESSLSSVLQAAQTPAPPPPVVPLPPPQPIFPQTPLFPPGEGYNPDKPGMLTMPPSTITPHPLPPPPPVSTVPTSAPTEPSHHGGKPYIHTVKRAPSSLGAPRSFKLVDGSNIITGVVTPVNENQTTLIIRDIPYQSNDSAILSHHLGKFGPIKQLQCKVYNDNHTAMVEYHSHSSAVAAFNSNEAVLSCRFIKVFWKEVVPISLAPSYFTNTGNLSKTSIHQSMNLVNTPSGEQQHNTNGNSNGNAAKVSAPAPVPKERPSVTTPNKQPSNAMKKLELAKRTQGLLTSNIANQKLILSKLEKCKNSAEKKSLLGALKKLQESHASIKASFQGLETTTERKRKPRNRSTLGAATNLDLRPKEIVVKNCSNAEELQVHFSKFGTCTVIPSGVGIIIGFDTRRDAEMAYVKGRMVDDQELDIEWNKNDTVQQSQVAVEPIR